MSTQTRIKSNFQYFIATFLVRWKFIRESSIEINEINQLISPQLPVSFEMVIPGGEGKLIILDVEIAPAESGDCITAQILCNFSVNINKNRIYNTHLHLELQAKSDYCKINKTISPSGIQVTAMQLIADQYSMIKDTRKLIATFLPEPMKTVFLTTLLTTGKLLETLGKNDIVKYLSLYLTGNKQRILDFHHKDIENNIINFAKSGSLSYQLDETDLDEKLFLNFGHQVQVVNEQLLFIFHPGQASDPSQTDV